MSESSCHASDGDLLTFRTALRAEAQRAAAEFGELRDPNAPRAALLAMFPDWTRDEIGAWFDDRIAAFMREHSEFEQREIFREQLIVMRLTFHLAAPPHCWTAEQIHAARIRDRDERTRDAELSAIATVALAGDVDCTALLRLIDEHG